MNSELILILNVLKYSIFICVSYMCISIFECAKVSLLSGYTKQCECENSDLGTRHKAYYRFSIQEATVKYILYFIRSLLQRCSLDHEN